MLKSEHEESQRPRVLLVGRNYSSNLCMARSFGKAGYEVEILRIYARRPKTMLRKMKPDAYSQYVKAFHVCVTNFKYHRVIHRLIELANEDQKMLLIPMDDLMVSVIDDYYDELSEYYIIPNANEKAGEINRLMNKEEQNQLAIEAGLPVVNSCVIKTEHGKFTIPETVTYPCFIKPNVSKNGLKSRMKKCESEDELRETLSEYSKYSDVEMIVEDYLEIGRELSILGVSSKEKVVAPGLFAAKKGGHDARRGVAFTGEVLPTAYLGDLIEDIKAFILTLKYEGLFDVDLIETTDGKVYFVELNLRYGGSGYSIVESGVNLPGMFADHMLAHQPLKDCQVEVVGKKFVSEKIGFEEYVDNCISMKELKDEIEKADIHFIMDQEDVKPYQHFKKFYFFASISRFDHKIGFTKGLRNIKRKLIAFFRFFKPLVLGYPQSKRGNQRDSRKKPRIILVGRNFSSNLCMARSFGKAGYEVEILRIYARRPRLISILKQMKPDAYSQYVKAFYECVTNFKYHRVIHRLLELANEDQKMLLIPTDDLMVSVIDEYYDELSEYYIIPNANKKAGEINHLMNKEEQNQLAIEAGLPVVNSCVIKTEHGKFTIPETVTYPCFIKPNVSKNGLKSRMKKCESEDELRETLIEYSKYSDVEMIVEDYLEIGRELSILGVSSKEKVVAPGLFAAKKGGHDARRGVAFTGEVLPTAYLGDLIEDIKAFILTLKYEGLFDVDLIETTDGKVYFVELNLRYGGSGYSIVESGVNLPGMFADHMLAHQPLKDCQVEVVGKKFVSEKIGFEEYVDNCISMKELKDEIEKADIHFIMDKEDVKPYQHFKKFYFFASIRRHL